MNEDLKYSNLRRSFEKNLTRKTDENERSLIKWMIKESIHIESQRSVHKQDT